MRYDLDDLRARVPASLVAEQELGVTIKDGRCAATWRGGDNETSVEFYKDGGYHDFAIEEGGSGATLLSVARGWSLKEAANYLGDKYCPAMEKQQRRPQSAKRANDIQPGKAAKSAKRANKAATAAAATTTGGGLTFGRLKPLKPAATSRYEKLIADGYKVVAEYHYQYEDGAAAYTVVRLEAEKDDRRLKEFLQRTGDSWGVRGVKLTLYRLPQVTEAKKVYVVEGEKDADYMHQRGLVATSCTGGAGKWQDSYSSLLAGKEIIIIGDNDAEGRKHAAIIAQSVVTKAKSVKVIFPAQSEKGDIADFFIAGGTNADLLAIEQEAPVYTQPRAGVITPEMLAVAKETNRLAFANFEYDKEGKSLPKSLNSMLSEFNLRLLGYPYKLGNAALFDHDKDTREISEISNPEKLFEWISRKTGHNYSWKGGTGLIPRREFYEAVHATAPRFESISDTPDYPENEEVYYTFTITEKPSPQHRAFEKLLDFFCPATDWHRVMIKTFFAAPIWYRRGRSRPSWVIDSIAGRQAGKTAIAEKNALLYRCQPIRVSRGEVQSKPDEVVKRIISTAGRKSRIVLLDNVTGEFYSENLADWITASSLSGRPPYSAGEETRPNNLTWVITSNGARLDTDMTSRSFFIALDKPRRTATSWNEAVINYIESHRMQIFADIIDIMQQHRPFDMPPETRHAEFEQEVLQAMCGDIETYQSVLAGLRETAEGANLELDECHQLVDCIRAKLADAGGIDPTRDSVWIHSDLFRHWTKEIGRRLTCQDARNFSREGMTPRFDRKLARFPRSSSNDLRRSGVMWIGEQSDLQRAKIVGMVGGAVGVRGIEVYNEEQ